MNLYLRFLFFVLAGLFRKKTLPVLGEVATRLRVLPNDLDLNRHMNNGRYLTVMDLARFDMIGRSGLFRAMIRRKWAPILGGAEIEFYRPLKLWQPYEILSRIECWDDKWFVISQRFVSREKLVAQAYVRGLFRGPAGNVPVSELFESVGETAAPRDQIPEEALRMLRAAPLSKRG